MNITAPARISDAHEKTIDLRIDRLRTAVQHADTIRNEDAPTAARISRALTVLLENRGFVTAHMQARIDQIIDADTGAAEDDLLLTQVRPLTLLIEQANIAIARLRRQHRNIR